MTTVKTIRKRKGSKGKGKGSKRQDPVPKDLLEGTILTIDPGTRFLGWAVSKISSKDDKFSADLIDHGTICGEGEGTPLVIDIVSKLDVIMEKYNPTTMCLENYLFLVGKNKQGDPENTTKYRKGLFAIPSLLGVLKYHWYLRRDEEPIMIYAATWKAALCGKAYANKEDVKLSLSAHLPKKVVQAIRDEYSDKGGKGEQDCLDAIAMSLYVCKRIDWNRKIKDTELE
jgi:Holliday junction resolvasome RuvABC endonuclease subunit